MLTPASIEVVKITTKTRLERNMVRALNEYSTIELIDVEQKGSGSSESNYESDVLSLLANVSSALDTLGIDPEKVLSSQKNQFNEENLQELIEELSGILGDILPEIDKYKNITSKISNEITDLKNISEVADRLTPLGLSFDLLHKGSHFYLVSGLVKKDRQERLNWNVKELTKDQYFLSSASYDKNENVVVVGVLKEYEGDLTRVLTSFGFSEFEIPTNITGDPSNVLAESSKEILLKEEELNNWLEKKIELASEYQNTLVAVYEQLNIEKIRLEARQKFRRTQYTVELWAFLPKNQKETVEKVVFAIDPDALLTFEDPHFDHEEYPTLLENNKVIKPFESLVYAFGAPTYKHDWDPTFLMAFTFPIFFGIMFGDVGHGFMVLILALLGFRYDPNQGGLKGLLAQARAILLAFAISAMFFGFMFGSFLGLEGELSPIPALWFSPEVASIDQFGGASGQFALLQLSFVVGNVHIISGLVLMSIGMWNHHERVKMIFFPVFLIIGYVLALLLVFSFGLDFAAWFSTERGYFDISIIPILGYNEQALIQIPSALFVSGPMLLIFVIFFGYMLFSEKMNGVSEAIDFLLTLLSNSVSYARLFAVFIVHGILARLVSSLFGVLPGHEEQLFHHGEHSQFNSIFEALEDLIFNSIPNLLSLVVDHLALFITLLLGATIVMSLELLITTIQSIRLHWVEWFSKMHYQGGGHQFDAFKTSRKFTEPSTIEELRKVAV
ncbi:MAG: V-type ATP synthase subunit I [Candidatus Hodarchaeales archaeon]|jgi:vacuolar-type H+-ATPase subunit I/STV1